MASTTQTIEAPANLLRDGTPQFYGGVITGYSKEAMSTPYKYESYMPSFEALSMEPYQPFEHVEHGKDADPSFHNLLQNATVTEMTGNIGLEVRGVQLTNLNNAGRDELALLAAQKKVVVFREQDFADRLSVKEAVEWGEYYGPSQVAPTAAVAKGHAGVDIIYRNVQASTVSSFFLRRTTGTEWHGDSSYELQPPGTTIIYMLDGPTTGSDTVYCNMVEAYNRLSPEYQKRLHGLKAVHSNVEQAAVARSRTQNSIVRRTPIEVEHPIVRTHPVTGEKALFVNPGFTTRVVGYKPSESDNLLKFLYDHIAFSVDLHCRVKWEKGTVVVWDNRVTTHTVVMDISEAHRRHLARITPMAEKPYETPFEG